VEGLWGSYLVDLQLRYHCQAARSTGCLYSSLILTCCTASWFDLNPEALVGQLGQRERLVQHHRCHSGGERRTVVVAPLVAAEVARQLQREEGNERGTTIAVSTE